MVPVDKQVIADARRMTGEPEDSSYIPSDPREFANRIFHTCYMGTENSSAETRRRAKQLADAIGRYVRSQAIYESESSIHCVSYHTDLNMDTVVTALRNLFGFVTGVKPQFRAHGGSTAENLALQNIQVRVVSITMFTYWPLYCIFRPDYGWCSPTCLHSCCRGCGAESEVCSCSAAPMSMKGESNLFSSSREFLIFICTVSEGT